MSVYLVPMSTEPFFSLNTMKFFFSFKSFYLGVNFKNKSHMEERFGLALGDYYLGNYVGDGWCFGKLDSKGCLIE